jgi:hypothetical protein
VVVRPRCGFSVHAKCKLLRSLLCNYWSGLLGFLSILGLFFVRVAIAGPNTGILWDLLQPILFSLGVFLAAVLLHPVKVTLVRWQISRIFILVLFLGIVIAFHYAFTNNTLSAWILVGFIFISFLFLDEIFVGTFNCAGSLRGWFFHIIISLACGMFVSLIGQFESNFADEEFFVAAQVLILAAFFLALRSILSSFGPKLTELLNQHSSFPKKGLHYLLTFNSHSLFTVCLFFAIIFSAAALHLYQSDFYPTEAPTYPGISADSPFICGEISPDPVTYSGLETYDRLLARIAANPLKGSPEYGMLALGTTDSHWLELFHDKLLNDARQSLFTGPSGSIKSGQYEAALRIYYYSRVKAAFPALFFSSEEQIIHSWIVKVNRRAFTVEPVDFLYGIAFSKWPQGPYENQEIGSGLFALLESTGLSDPAFSPRNMDYLASNPRGWAERFRVTDDAIIYQPEWINNALFQSYYAGSNSSTNLRLSFEWLLMQSLPDGSPLLYNHIFGVSSEGVGLLAAKLIGDNRFVWAAARSLDYLEAHSRYASAQPGLDSAVDLNGTSPTEGSCLLFGDSGLPNQVGPLAPDKIVFRDGWQVDSTYLLLNLRFTGWHRYKATNSISLVYQDGPLVAEKLDSQIFKWLPKGRNLFRDKRIPRENLNGLVISKTGLRKVLFDLTGIFGSWEQDPPYYAEVKNFSNGEVFDSSVTQINDWHGWTHNRSIFLYHDGPLIVIDNATGIGTTTAAITWHIPQNELGYSEQRIEIRSGKNPAEMVLVPISGKITIENDDPGLYVKIQNSKSISLVTIFLTGQWTGAEVIRENDQLIINGPTQIKVDIPEE